MFSYRPPKGSCWGHMIRPRDPSKAKERVNNFFGKYFERLEPEWDTTRQLTFELKWNEALLPNVDWPKEFLRPENERWRRVLLLLTGNRVMFMQFLIPISAGEVSSYEFLGRFSAEAPFKMSPKHFQVGLPAKNGSLVWRKATGGVAARLQELII